MVWRPFLRHVTQSSARLSDQCGRLNSTWTVAILLLFSLLTFYLHIGYNPVTCWTPRQFTAHDVAYVHKLCWDSQHYVLDENNSFSLREEFTLLKSNYRWIPLILLIQALLFKLPDVISTVGQGLVGFRMTKILGLTEGYASLNMADRSQMGRQVGRYVKSWIDSTVLKGCPWGLLTLLVLFTKFLYFINVITQLSVMNSVLTSQNESSFGSQLANDISSNETSSWRIDDPVFRKIFFCDFGIRALQNVQRFTVQCYLSNATYYEMMFGFLWLWMVVVTVVTALSGVVHLLVVLVPIFRKRYIKRYLHLSEEVAPCPSDNDIGRFAGSEITEDGVMILKAIGEASSEHLVRDAVIYLWLSTHPQQPPQRAEHQPVHLYSGQQVPPSQHPQQGAYYTGPSYGRDGTVVSPPHPSAPMDPQVRYRPQAGGSVPESIPLVEKQPM